MNKQHALHLSRSHTKKWFNPCKPRLSVAEKRARKARKQLVKLFPHLAPRLHKGVSIHCIYQHALSLSHAHAGSTTPGADPPCSR